MEIKITDLTMSQATYILNSFRGSTLGDTDMKNKICNVFVHDVMIIQAVKISVPDSFKTENGIKICTHDDNVELLDIDYGVIKIL